MADVENRRWNQWCPQLQKSVEDFKEQHYKVTTRKSLPGNSNPSAEATRSGSRALYNHLAELMKVRQTGSVEQYRESFNSLIAGLELPVSYVILCFISGLKAEIRTGVRLFNLRTLHEAYCLALLQEATLASIARKTTPNVEGTPSPLRTAQWAPLQQSTIVEPRSDSLKQEQGPPMEVKNGIATQLESAAGGKPTRLCLSLSPAEIFAKWDKGLCELCDEPYVPGHKCKKIGPNTLFVVVAEEEDPLQPAFGVDNRPAMDAPQVFDESPKPRTCIKSEGRNGNGHEYAQEGLGIVPFEQLGGLNLSNGLFEKSISSIHDKDPDLSEQGEIREDANAGMSMDEELHMLAGYSKVLGLQSAVPVLQDLNLLARWISKNSGWRKANDFCGLVFDPGILGPGQGALRPDIVVFNSALTACVPSHQWKAVSWVLEQLKKGGLQTNGATYGLAIEVRLHSKMYERCLVHELDRRRCYWGYCCETLATEDSRRGGGEGIQHIDANVGYCSVIKTKPGAHCLLRGVEMVCCDPTDDGRRFYVELKASRKLDYHTEVSYEREKLLKFWIQSFLAGIPYIVVGFRNDSGRLVRTERMRTKDITYRVKMKGYWQGGVSLAFADEVLCDDYILQFAPPLTRLELKQTFERRRKETVVRFAFHSGDIADDSTAREVEKTHPQEAATDADTGNQGVEESAQVDSTADKMEALAYEENEAPDEVKEDTNKKCHLNGVLIDHVDAGQSTIAGRTLNLSRQGDEKTAEDTTRGSWYVAYLMDTNEEERAKGITTEGGKAHFETETTRFTILDASGYKRYVPNLINGASQADVGIVVFSVRKREFEIGPNTESRRDGWFEILIPIATAQQEQQENPGWKCTNSFCLFVFDPGGTLPLSTGLPPVSHTIHALDAVGTVFDPGGKIISRYVGPSPSESRAVTDINELGSADIGELSVSSANGSARLPIFSVSERRAEFGHAMAWVTMRMHFKCKDQFTLLIIRSQHSSIVSLPVKLEDKLLEGGRLIRAKGSHVRGMRLVVRVSWEFADSARDHQVVRQLAGKMPFPLPIKAV